MIKERPIIFSADMVNAILKGTKTQTRRVIKPQPDYTDWDIKDYQWLTEFCPYGQIGDQLWVREAYYDRADYSIIGKYQVPRFVYCADGEKSGWKKHSPIYMPREASRITLEIKNIRVERLQDISASDCMAEGLVIPVNNDRPLIEVTGKYPACSYMPKENKTVDDVWRAYYFSLWDTLNDKRGYGVKTNPFVWVIEITKNAISP